jgi:putative thioredoxin
MLTADSNAPLPVPPAAAVVEVTAQNFRTEVVDASRSQVVLVDFWAEWCGPCKALTPVLEKVVASSKGKVKLAKVNVDQQQMLAGQFRVQSLPTVYALVDGRPVDAFQGALPEAQVRAFVDKLVGMLAPDQGAQDIEAALQAADAALAAGVLDEAQAIYAAVLDAEPDNAPALIGLAKCALSAGDAGAAESLLAQLPEAAAKSAGALQVKAGLALMQDAKPAADPAALSARLAADPKDHDARITLARDAIARSDLNAAADQLLESIRIDRAWNDGAARQLLLRLFEAMGHESDFTVSTRRRLSAILFS